MLPILISLGPVKIYSYGVCLAIGLFLAMYWWWKMGRDEHWDEIALFDAFFLSALIYLGVGRTGYVIGHMSQVGTLYRFLAILAYPGINVIAGVLGSAIFVWLFARAKEWYVWKVADAYVVALGVVLCFGALGGILNGSSAIWQINVWGMVWAILTFGIVARVRKDFRFYGWYKGESSIAQEGLASLVFGMAVGVYYLGVRAYLVGALCVVASAFLIYRRVGRRETSLWSKLRDIIERR